MKARKELNRCLFMQKTCGIKRQPLNAEAEQYTDICSGDMAAVRESFSRIEENLQSRQLSNDTVRNIRYHLVIAAAAISKACIENGMGHDEAYTLADIYIRKADKSSVYEELLELFRDMELDFAERMQEIRKQSVISLHVRKCIDYIYEHLGEGLTVNELAAYCGLNPSYLSKLFYSETGVHLKQFVLEAKIDTAQNLLKHTNLSSSDISTALGFSSQSSFICTFRKTAGITPKKFREKYFTSEQ